ncbi:MAG TPA: flavin reductase [Saprospirales bacterium]|nr:flavin reductase [Saprospirales bacterium]HAY70640.1 flavin reductase [Saprospirales bacterium]HRQ28540.1 flavin reductase family protein [Saprospiraceae bacterium]
MKEISLDNTSRKDFHQFMLGSVIPRPIALVGTISRYGVPNLAPFSYFNAVSSIPPVLMFSLSRKGIKGNKKDTLLNIEQNPEFTVNMVSYPQVWPMVLSSVEFPSDVDEFKKSGFSPLESKYISPFRVKECLIQFECKLREIKELGENTHDCTLVFGDVVCLHVDESILTESNRIDPFKLDITGRLGKEYYARIAPESIFSIQMQTNVMPTGYDLLPEHIKQSEILTANEIGRLAAIPLEIYEKYYQSFQNKIKKTSENLSLNHHAVREALLTSDDDKAMSLIFDL